MTRPVPERRVLVAVTGASGAVLAECLIQQLLQRVDRIYCVFSDAGEAVVRHELETVGFDQQPYSLRRFVDGDHQQLGDKLRRFANDDYFSPLASGTSGATDMVVVPCSMGTAARIAQGVSSTLIERAADVVLKEKRRLVLVPREMPLSILHLRNLTTLAEFGATVLPSSPAFYLRPKTLEDAVRSVVGKILESLDFKHDLYPPWNARMI